MPYKNQIKHRKQGGQGNIGVPSRSQANSNRPTEVIRIIDSASSNDNKYSQVQIPLSNETSDRNKQFLNQALLQAKFAEDSV